MSAAPVSAIMLRITNASPKSPIAVFKVRGGKNSLNAVFAETVLSRQQIEKNSNLVGVFDKRNSFEETRKILLRAAARSFDE